MKLVDREAVIDKLVYTAANPVADHLVDRVRHWPGANGLTALLTGRPLRATRPLHFFRSDGPMPDALELPLTLPAELGPAAAVLAELRDRVRAIELEREAERGRTRRRVLGRRAVLAQSWRDHPASVELRRNLRPQLAGRSKWARIEALLRNRAFATEYASAAIDGETAWPPCSRPGPTGSSGSRRCRCTRRDLVRATERSRRAAQQATCRHRLVPRVPGRIHAPTHRPVR